MDAIIDDLALSIISECDPHSLSNLSLVDKRYHGILHGNSVLMLLSIRHDVKLESFEEYQLFCEIKYLVPQSSKHYDMNYYQMSIDIFNSPLSIDDMVEKFKSTYDTSYSADFICKCLYDEEAHITGNLEPNNPKIEEFMYLTEVDIDETVYLEYLIRRCPDNKIVSQYWDTYGDRMIKDSEDNIEILFRGLFNECLLSTYCIERLHWFNTINCYYINVYYSYEYFTLLDVHHPYVTYYMTNHHSPNKFTSRLKVTINNRVVVEILSKMGDDYKYGERVDKLIQKMKW